MRGDDFLLDGTVYGHKMGFWDFCSSCELDLKAHKIPDVSGIRVTKDWRCPLRKRIVLHEGCFYGAPVGLVEFNYRRAEHIERPFSRIINDILNLRKTAWQEADEKHQAFMHVLREPLVVVYEPARQQLTVNKVPITTGIQARILNKVLSDYVSSGDTEFYHGEFTARPEFISDPLNTGFSTSLKRLMTTLDKKECGIRLIKAGSGRFSLQTQSDVILKNGLDN